MYNLELDFLVKEIKKKKSKRILIQLPDGLKNRSEKIVQILEEETGAEVLIWFTSCFGACDIPLGIELLKIDLLVQFGHSIFLKEKEW